MPLVIYNQFPVIGSLFSFREFNFPATAKIYTQLARAYAYAAVTPSEDGALQFARRDNPSLSRLRTLLSRSIIPSSPLMIVVRFIFRHTHTHSPLSTHHRRLSHLFRSRTNGYAPAPLIAPPYYRRLTKRTSANDA